MPLTKRFCCIGCRVCLLGLLKTGHKTLYLRDGSNAYCTRQPLCVLDFFVLPQHQRQGIGQAMFQVNTTAHLLSVTPCIHAGMLMWRLWTTLFSNAASQGQSFSTQPVLVGARQ